MPSTYPQLGYQVITSFLSYNELSSIRHVALAFHDAWQKEHWAFYQEKAINSAYLTGSKYLNLVQRAVLFKLIGSKKLVQAARGILGEVPCFMNTQLFFNPVNVLQRSYWHRDMQYHLSLEEQQQALKTTHVIHLRLPLFDEPGVEFIPGTHRRWDTQDELDVRLEHHGRKHYENLRNSVQEPLSAGDLCIFSANMLHRGIYGGQRLALDILLFKSNPEIIKFVDRDCLPSKVLLQACEVPDIFQNTLDLTLSSESVQ